MTSALVMAKAPRPGTVKTRLEPLLGPEGCAALQAALIATAARWALTAAAPGGTYLAFAPSDAEGELRDLVGPGVTLIPDASGDLGDRLAGATGRVMAARPGPLLVAGTDLPALAAEHARAALAALDGGADVCFGPAADGGYYLVGLRRPAPELFALGDAWGGPDVLERSLALARAGGLRTALLGEERDLDVPADARAALEDPRVPAEVARALRPVGRPTPPPEPDEGVLGPGMRPPEPDEGVLGPGMRPPEPDEGGLRPGMRPPEPEKAGPLVSVIVPTYDEEAQLPGTLDHLRALPGRFELLVADGGSGDRTLEIARDHPAAPRVVVDGENRAGQLNAAAAAARGELLLFLHADSRLPQTAYESLAAAHADREIVGGNFTLRFDGGDRFARLLTGVYALERRRGYYYGDSSVWVRRETFAALGGYRPLAIMDDYDFVRRIERHGPTARLPGPALTSPRRWRALGVTRTLLSWCAIRWLFLCGVSPDRLARLYRRMR